MINSPGYFKIRTVRAWISPVINTITNANETHLTLLAFHLVLFSFGNMNIIRNFSNLKLSGKRQNDVKMQSNSRKLTFKNEQLKANEFELDVHLIQSQWIGLPLCYFKSWAYRPRQCSIFYLRHSHCCRPRWILT